MARRPMVQSKRRTASLPRGRNPRDIPLPQLDASAPQPKAPERSPIKEEEQDRQPLDPAPLIGRAPNPERGTREEKNG